MLSRLDMIPQDYLDMDWCDICGVELPPSSEVWLDIDKGHGGAVPAYCKTCADKIKEDEA